MKINRGIGLALAAVFSLLSAAGLAEVSTFRPESEMIAFSTAASGDAVYLYDAIGQTYYRMGSGGEAEARAASEIEPARTNRFPLILVGDGDRVCVVETEVRRDEDDAEIVGAALYELRFDGPESAKICDLDISDLLYEDEGGQGILPCESALLDGDMLYLLFDALDGEEGFAGFGGVDATEEASRILLCANTATGERTELRLKGVTQLVSAKDGEVLCARPNAETGGAVLSSLSLEDETWSDLVDLKAQNSAPPENFVFDGESGRLFYTTRNRIWGMKGRKEQPQLVGSAPTNFPIGMLRCGGNALCVYSGDMACIVPIDWEYKLEVRKLVVSGGSLSLDEYAAERADIDLIYTDGMSSEQIVNAVLTQSPTPDIFIITSYDPVYAALRDRGYLLPLAEAGLLAYAEKLHPDLLSAVRVGGELCAIPTGLVQQDMCSVNIDLWNGLGLGDPPQTWEDMALFLRDWPDMAAEFPDVAPILGFRDAAVLEYGIRITAVQEYERYRSNREELTGYDTREFRSLMELLDSIDYEALVYEDDDPPRWLFSMFYYPTLRTSGDPSDYPLPLSVAEGAPAYASAIVSVLAVNPYSTNRDIALDYMQYAVEHLDPVDRLEIMVGENEPVRDPHFEVNLESRDQRIAEIEASLASATSDSDRERFQGMLESAREARLEMLDHVWMVGEEQIAEYRRATERIDVMYSPGINNADANRVGEMQFAFANGEIGLEEFIREMDRLITMREREGT